MPDASRYLRAVERAAEFRDTVPNADVPLRESWFRHDDCNAQLQRLQAELREREAEIREDAIETGFVAGLRDGKLHRHRMSMLKGFCAGFVLCVGLWAGWAMR